MTHTCVKFQYVVLAILCISSHHFLIHCSIKFCLDFIQLSLFLIKQCLCLAQFSVGNCQTALLLGQVSLERKMRRSVWSRISTAKRFWFELVNNNINNNNFFLTWNLEVISFSYFSWGSRGSRRNFMGVLFFLLIINVQYRKHGKCRNIQEGEQKLPMILPRDSLWVLC